MTVEARIVEILEEEGIDCVCSVPCVLLKGLLEGIENSPITHIPITREEEGVGVAAGVALAGKKPVLIMENSGLGNCINALLSLTRPYKLPLVLLISQRDSSGEETSVLRPMNKATPKLLEILRVTTCRLKSRDDLIKLRKKIRKAFHNQRIEAVLLTRELWNESS
jgi:sulfopyruvate decarboxylase subunit alpha